MAGTWAEAGTVPIVLDASVALKLIVHEPGSEAMWARLERDEERLAPEWLRAEIASALAQKVRFEGLDRALALHAYAEMPQFVDRFVGIEAHVRHGIKLSVDLGHAFYDCLYLAIAEHEDATLLTADAKFAGVVTDAGKAERVELLKW